MTLSATPAEVERSQPLTLRLEVIAETGVTIDIDDYGQTLTGSEHRYDFRVLRKEKETSKPINNGRLRWTCSFDVEFILPGEYELPGAGLSFVDERAGASDHAMTAKVVPESQTRTLATDPLLIVVRGSASDAELTAEELARIETLDPIDLPMEWKAWWFVVSALALIGLAAAAFLVIRRSRSVSERALVVPAHEWARTQIAALVAEDLITRGEVQEFYYRISDIVRGYIERRYRMAAPEMTTEEFLAAAGCHDHVTRGHGTPRFGRENTEALVRFLNACDPVKYACHQPDHGEWDELLHSAGEFVERTREDSAFSSEPGPGAPRVEEHQAV